MQWIHAKNHITFRRIFIMIKNRKLDHIGLAVTDVEASKNWYCDVLGFEVIGSFRSGSGNQVYFIKSGDVVYEMFQKPLSPELQGKIDHISYVSNDIEADYAFCVKQGYPMATEKVMDIPTFWEKGCRYFKLASPTGEQVEFCQIL